jgi:hypothetical protein
MSLLDTIRIFNNWNTKNIEATLHEFSDFVFVVNYLNNAFYDGKVSIKPWQKHLEMLLFKLSQHGGSLIDTIKGKDRRRHIYGEKVNYSDMFSSYVLARALMETYLMNYYLNFECANEDQCNFRLWLYEMSGLFRRQDYTVTLEEGKKQIAEEKIQIEGYKQLITNNKYFQSLPPKRQRKLISGSEAKEYSYEQIISTRGIVNQQFHIQYRLYSNYAHSEYLSLIQLNHYTLDKQSTLSALNALINEQIFILCLQIIDIITNFKAGIIAYNSLPREVYENVETRIKLANARFFDK